MKQNERKNMKIEKIENCICNKEENLMKNKSIVSKKNEYQTKILKAKNDLSSLIREGPISTTIRNYDTHDLILYIQNNNNYINNIKTSNNNSCDKKKEKNIRYDNKMNNYLNKAFLNLGVKTEANNNKNKNNPKKQNSQLLIEIMNSNSNEDLNKDYFKSKNKFQNEDNKRKNKKIRNKKTDNDFDYSNTEVINLSNERSSNNIYKNDRIISWKNNKDNKDNKESSQRKKILNSHNKSKNNNIIINVSNNNLFNNANRLYINNKTSSNSINNYFKIKNMNLHFLNEVHHSPTEINVLTNLNQEDSFKKLKLNISGDLLFKQKIRKDLDPIKKNKELSQKLEDTSKELDKMQNIRKKYISSINKNINMQKEFKNIKRKNETFSKDLEIKDKEINEQTDLIIKLTEEINNKNKYINEMKEAINKKDEIINI